KWIVGCARRCHRTRTGQPILWRSGRFELQFGRVDVDQWPEFVDVAVAVVVERDVGGDVERSARQLGRERTGRILEIVVAVDEHARVAVGQYPLQARARDVGEGQVDRPLDVQ